MRKYGRLGTLEGFIQKSQSDFVHLSQLQLLLARLRAWGGWFLSLQVVVCAAVLPGRGFAEEAKATVRQRSDPEKMLL